MVGLVLLLSVCVLLAPLLTDAQDVQLIFMGDTIANNSVVSIEEIRVHVSEANTDAVLCMTTLAGCCDSSDVGEWFFPNAMEVLSTGPGGDLYSSRSDTGLVILNRRNSPTSPTGIFHCVIPTQLSPQRVNEDLYVGIYTTSTGAPVLDSLAYDAGSTTLSCTSSGGPATNVLWTRNCLAVGSDDPSFEQTQIVTDTANAVYLNKLTIIAGATDGAYGCSVSNSRGASGSMETGVGVDFEDRSAVVVTITPAANPTAGSPHTLTCDPNSGTGSPVQVQWFGPDGNQLQTGGGITVSTQSPFTLTFTQLRESNAGLYVCQATVGTPGVDADSGCTSTQVTMQDPTVTVTATGGDAIAGQVFTLTCQASGVTVSGPDDPDLDYSWRRGGAGPVLSAFRSYALAVQVTDAGDDYTCEVTYSPSFLDQSGSVTSVGTTTLNVAIRQPTIEINLDPFLITYYTGLGLTLQCDLDIPGPQLLAVEADITVSGPSGAISGDSRVTVGEVVEDTAGDAYSRVITFSALSSMLDDGLYTCMGTVRPTTPSAFITNGEGTGSRQLNVVDPVFNIALAPITTRVLNVDPYNNFTLTCAFSSSVSNMPVNVPKSVQWTRAIGSGPATVVTAATPGIEITDSGLDQSSGTSVLAMTADSAGEHVFECLVRLDVAAVPDDVEAMAATTVTVIGPADPLAVVNLVATAVTHNSATIQWTVPSIAYTPETYVVRYGTNSVNRVSAAVLSGGDISVTDLTLSAELTGLEQLTGYMYEVQSSSGMGRATTSSRETFMTTNLPPNPPTMLEPTMTADTSFTFTWVAPTVTNGPLTGYEISCSPQLEGIPQSETVSVDSAALTGAIAGLFHGVAYTCEVRALNEAGPSTPVTVDVITTTVAPTGYPQNFEGTAHSGGRSIFFTWDPPSATTLNGPISNYTITCTATGTPPVVDVATMAPATVVGFAPVTEYNCNIFVSNPQGNGPRTTPFVNITTLEGTPDAAPQNVMVEHIQESPDTVLFTWDPPPAGERNGVIAGYIIACTPTPSGDTRALTSNDTSITFDMLQPGTTYGCTFLAFTSPGNGPTAELPLLTLPGQPVILEVANVSSTSLRVSWNSSGGEIDTFIIFANGAGRPPVPASTDPLVYIIEGLDPFQCVDVQVAASNQAGEGPLSETVVQKTNQARPGVVSCTDGWVSSSATELVVSWEQPESPNGIITGYYLELHEYQVTGAAIASREITDNSTSTTFSGLALEEGVPYTVSITAETIVGRGAMACASTDFIIQLVPPPIQELVITRSENQTVIIITWGVPTLREAGGFVTYEITFSSRKRQSSTAMTTTTCTVAQSVCSVPIEQGGVEVSDADPDQDYAVTVVPVNGDGERGQPITLNAGVRTSSILPVVVGAVVGGLGGIAVLLCLIFIAVCCFRHSRKTSRALNQEPEERLNQRYSPIDGDEKGQPASGSQELEMFAADRYTPPPYSTTSPLYEDDGVDHMAPIPLSEFPAHVAHMHQDRDKGFEREYGAVPNTEAAHEVATLNKLKNRFANIYPFDTCRVKLAEIPGVECSDYVNASYIDGYNKNNAYIAAQGPMPNTLTDFWRMIWEHRLTTVVMLTKCTEGGKRKCEQYWPDNVNDTFTPSGSSITVLMTELQAFADYEIRKFLVTDEAQEDSVPLEVMHYYFVSWPDHGVPLFATALIGFIRRVRMSFDKHGPPMLIHCSAGVGRTGTYIALDSVLERITEVDTINVFELLCQMREKRISMVQTSNQYVFIHDALEELITCGNTAVTAPNLRSTINRLHKIVPGTANKGFEEQFALLNRVSRKYTETECSNALEKFNQEKNRYPDKVPFNVSRARLRPTGAAGAEYINASFVDGYKKRSAYIAAQAPLRNTVDDFWKLIWEFKTKVIVQVCSFNEGGEEACFPYWPTTSNDPIMYGKVRVTLVTEKPDSSFIVRKFEVKEEKASVAQNQPASFIVTQFHCPEWPEDGRPPNSGIILKLLEEMAKVERSTATKHITVVCNDGVGRTGTFMCIHSMLDRLKTEGIVDFFQFIKSSRIHRAGLVTELEHYIFCHDVLADFLNSFDTYANFKDLTRRSQVHVL